MGYCSNVCRFVFCYKTISGEHPGDVSNSSRRSIRFNFYAQEERLILCLFRNFGFTTFSITAILAKFLSFSTLEATFGFLY